MHLSLQLALLSLAAGAAYALSAMGLILVYKGSGVLNFSHGAIGMIGTYVYVKTNAAGLPLYLALVIGIATSGLLGILVELAVMRPLTRRSSLAKLVASFGVLLALEGFAQLKWGSESTSVPSIFSTATLNFGSYNVSASALSAVGLSIIVAATLYVCLQRTTFGKAIEAASIDETVTARLGYRNSRLSLTAWGAGSSLAGLAGIIVAPNIGLNSTALTLVVLQALVGALIGGLRAFIPALLASLLVGAGESIIVGQVSSPGWQEALPFIVIVLVLIVSGSRVPTRGMLGRSVKLPIVPRRQGSVLTSVILLVIGAAIVYGTNAYWRVLLETSMGFALVAVSVVMVTGILGELTLAQWPLAGVGAFVAASVVNNAGVGLVGAAAAGMTAAAGAGLLVGLPALRIRGISFGVVTLGAGTVIATLFLTNVWGELGVTFPAPEVFGVAVSDRSFAFAEVIIVVVVCFIASSALRTRVGIAALAVRASERAASASGISVPTTKLAVFTVAAAVAGLGGTLWAYSVQAVTPEVFGPLVSVQILAMSFLSGIGFLYGGVATGIAVGMGPVLLERFLHIPGASWFLLLSGAGVILAVQLQPDGFLGGYRQVSARAITLVRRVRGRGATSSAGDPPDDPSSAAPGPHTHLATIRAEKGWP